MPAERVENFAKERLHKFGLNVEDIVAAATDGGCVMKSFGKMICRVHQHCFAHGYHLAVTDFLYAKQNLFEGLQKKRENNNTESDSEFSLKEEMEEVYKVAVDLVETKAISVNFNSLLRK